MSVSVKQSLNNLYYLMEITTEYSMIYRNYFSFYINQITVLNNLQYHLHIGNCIHAPINKSQLSFHALLTRFRKNIIMQFFFIK